MTPLTPEQELDELLTELRSGTINFDDKAKQALIQFANRQRIDALLKLGKFSLPDKPSDFELQRLINDMVRDLQSTQSSEENTQNAK